ncbi:hypothetical protein ACLOJK_005697 [Asimina triloba]
MSSSHFSKLQFNVGYPQIAIANSAHLLLFSSILNWEDLVRGMKPGPRSTQLARRVGTSGNKHKEMTNPRWMKKLDRDVDGSWIKPHS